MTISKTTFNKTIIIKIAGAIGVIVFWFLIRDYLVSGSNVMAERYEFKVSKDSLMKVVTNFNDRQTGTQVDSVFFIDKGNPNFYEGYALSSRDQDSYLVMIPVAEGRETELQLISVTNLQTDSTIGVNHRPENKAEVRLRKMVIKNFEERVLDHLGLPYKHVGNAMNKVY
ncbi:hypothetical protein [Sphingobacterium bambusae]|uniref:DUF4230 domain-containing protein n=1 Tax=Sphingobacterium bambusae TaxID=662858 RepID=A0ABW6BNI5_9SPHI|nr:hypothetical protein [Sphingobacterium bambusae]WPL48064.1 hypothetical protein SCB77_19110 [Sphingobacterium bambusae]